MRRKEEKARDRKRKEEGRRETGRERNQGRKGREEEKGLCCPPSLAAGDTSLTAAAELMLWAFEHLKKYLKPFATPVSYRRNIN